MDEKRVAHNAPLFLTLNLGEKTNFEPVAHGGFVIDENADWAFISLIISFAMKYPGAALPPNKNALHQMPACGLHFRPEMQNRLACN
jgi:hypothetical protein